MLLAAFGSVIFRNGQPRGGRVLHFDDLLSLSHVPAIVFGGERPHNGEGVGTRILPRDGVHVQGNGRGATFVYGDRVFIDNGYVAFHGESLGDGQGRCHAVHEQHTLFELGHVAARVGGGVQAEVSPHRLDTTAAEFNVLPCQGDIAASVLHIDVGFSHVEVVATKLELQVSIEAWRCGVLNGECSSVGRAVATRVGGREDDFDASGGGTSPVEFSCDVAPSGHSASVGGGGASVVGQPSLVFVEVAVAVTFHNQVLALVKRRRGGVDNGDGLGACQRVAAVVRGGECPGHDVLMVARTRQRVGHFRDGDNAACFVHFRHVQRMDGVAFGRVIFWERHKFDGGLEFHRDRLGVRREILAGVCGDKGSCDHVLAVKEGGVCACGDGDFPTIVKRHSVFQGVLVFTAGGVVLRHFESWSLFVRHNDGLCHRACIVAIVQRGPCAVHHELVVAE